MTFAQDIDRFVSKTEGKFASAVQGTVIGVGKKVINGSPVGQWDKWSDYGKKRNPNPPYEPGEFVGSWKYAYGSGDSTHANTIDASGGASIKRFMAVSKSPVAGIHTIFNNAPYATVMESGKHPLNNEWHLIPPNQAHVVKFASMAFPGIVEGLAKALVKV